MRATVRFRLPDGSTSVLGAGDLIGRVAGAALRVDDPRVSEAHAIVSLRRGELYLLSLRRLIGVEGRPASEVVLTPGLSVQLADGVVLVVEQVEKPERVRALRSAACGVRPLGQVASIVAGSRPQVVARFVPGGAAHLWSSGEDEWRLRLDDGAARSIEAGDTFEAAGAVFEMCEIALDAAGHDATQGAGLHPLLRIVAHYDSVEIHREHRAVLMVGGIGARLISELVGFGGPVGWEVIARELWRDEADGIELRHRWDVALGRLRTRLREGGVRADLVRSDRGGQVQLILNDGDHVDDRT